MSRLTGVFVFNLLVFYCAVALLHPSRLFARAHMSYSDYHPSVGDSDEEPSAFLDYVHRIKPDHSTVEVTSLASFLNSDVDSLEGELIDEKDEYEAAFIDVVLHSGALVNNVTHERTWIFSQHLGLQKDHILSIHRWKIWWVIPRLLKGEHGESAAPAQTYFLLGKLPNSKFVLILPLNDRKMGFSLEGSQSSNRLTVTGYDNTPNAEEALRVEYDWNNHKKRMTKRRALIIAQSSDPHVLIKRSMKLAKEQMRKQLGMDREQIVSDVRERLEEIGAQTNFMSIRRSMWPRGPGPAFVDSLGWCTWDSFYTDLSPSGVLAGLKSFNATGIVPRFVILDDGWQDTNVNAAANGKQWGGKLASFSANFKFADGYDANPPTSTPAQNDASRAAGVLPGSTVPGISLSSKHSLKSVVSQARSQHRIKTFIVWHTLTGYWAGVDPSSEDMNSYHPKIVYPSIPDAVHRISKTDALRTEPFTLDGVGLVDPEAASRFFLDYHSELKGMGVDGVKVDAQSVLSLLQSNSADADDNHGGKNGKNAGARGGGGFGMVSKFHSALHESLRQLSSNNHPIIHCMCHSQDTLLSILALYPDEFDDSSAGTLVPVIRGSDDYWPLDTASHGPHLYANALNSLLFSHVALHDWDMFQSNMGRTSSMHAAARALSGGPVYVSDRPEQHNGALLRKLAFHDGSVPRPIRNARPAEQALFLDPSRVAGEPLIIQSSNPSSGLVIGVFSVAGAVLENDRDQFRFLSPSEMTWSHSGWEDHVASWEKSHPQPATLKETKAFYDDPAWTPYLSINWLVGSLDVEEGAKEMKDYAKRHGSQNTGHDSEQWDGVSLPVGFGATSFKPSWVAYRMSDGELFAYAAAESSVSVSLPRVFDYDIVSFAKIFPVSSGYGEGLDPSESVQKWGAFIGAVDMLNPGGAVLSTMVHEWQGSDDAAPVNEVPDETTEQQQIIAEQKRVLEERKRTPRMCPALSTAITEIEIYHDMWTTRGGGTGHMTQISESERDAAQGEFDAQLDKEISDLEDAIKAQSSVSGKVASMSKGDSLLQGIILEADLMGEGKFWFIASVPGARCRAEILMAKSLTFPDPDITVTARPVELQTARSPDARKSDVFDDNLNDDSDDEELGLTTIEVCLVEIIIGKVDVSNEGSEEEVRGVHVSVVVT